MIFFKSTYFTNYIYMLLDKPKGSNISLDDLDSIDSLTLNGTTLANTANDTVIEDLLYFRNLKHCTLINLQISDKEIFVLNNCSNLINLQFYNCSFSKIKEPLVGNIDMLSVISCSNFNIRYICSLKSLAVLNIKDMKKLKLNGIEGLFNLKKLYLQNIRNLSLNFIKYMDNLSYLNLDGSYFKNSKLLETINIKVEASNYTFINDSYMNKFLNVVN